MSTVIFQGIPPEQIAQEWSDRIANGMRSLAMDETEIKEYHKIMRSFCKTAIDLLEEEPELQLPHMDQGVRLDMRQAHLILDLFLRGVYQATHFYRQKGLDWPERKRKIEDVSWRLFNLSRLIVGLQMSPNPAFESLLHQESDLKVMMKHSTEELLREFEAA